MKKTPILLVTAMAMALAGTASAVLVNLNPTDDATIWHRDGTAGYGDYAMGATETQINNYHFDSNLNSYGYFRFDLSALGPIIINSASFTITQAAVATNNGLTGSDRNDTLVDGRVDFFGLNDVAGNTSQSWSEATLSFDTTGDEITTATIAANAGAPFVNATSFAGQDTVGAGTANLSSAQLVSFIQTRVDANGLVTLMNANPDATSNRGITYNSSEAASGQPVLTIDYTVIPEPTTFAMLLGGAGMLGLIRRRRS